MSASRDRTQTILSLIKEKYSIPDLIKRHLDCAVVNFLHDIREGRQLTPFDTVQAPFIEGKSLFPGSKLMDKCHVQWCVRDPKKSVIAYFRPRDPNATEV